MILDLELNTGLVFGLTADTIYLVQEATGVPSLDSPATIIYIYLGIFTVAFIFD